MEQNFVTSSILSKFSNIKHGFLHRGIQEDDIDYNNKTFQIFNSNVILPHKQLHTDNVFEITKGNKDNLFECDAFITKEKDTPIAVRTADCVPILIYASDINYIAVVHGGWKSLYLNIIEKVIKKLFSLGSQPGKIYVAIGPYIHSTNYEVDEKFINHFTHNGRDYKDCVEMIDGKYHVNLGNVVFEQLKNCGIIKKNIEDVKICTFASNIFPSFREMQKNAVDNSKRFYSFINIVL
jgi:YfiH family protein